MEHEQVCVKVNAYVDEKIAPVIEAMSKIDAVVTFCSCENTGNGMASISFFYKEEYENWFGIGKICDTLSRVLVEFEYAKISVDWRLGSTAYPQGHLCFETDTAIEIAEAMEKLLKNNDPSLVG